MITKLAWKQILITFAVSFVLGVAFGRWEFSDRDEMYKKWKTPEKKQQWIMKKLDRRLGLTAEQKPQVEAILKESIPQFEAIKAKVRPEIDSLRERTRQKIRPLLTVEQQEKYDQMITEWQERRRKYREAAGAT